MTVGYLCPPEDSSGAKKFPKALLAVETILSAETLERYLFFLDFFILFLFMDDIHHTGNECSLLVGEAVLAL